MQDLADGIAERGTFVDAFHNVTMVAPAGEDAQCAIVLVPDVTLAATRSKNGRYSFLQMVGLTPGELAAIRDWDARKLVALIAAKNPLFLFDPRRASYLRDAAFAKEVAEGAERDGSSMGIALDVRIRWSVDAGELVIHLAASEITTLRHAVKSRLRHGKNMILLGTPSRADTRVVLAAEAGPSRVEGDDGHDVAVLRLDRDAIAQLDALSDAPGAYTLAALAGVRFIVAPSGDDPSSRSKP
jgi:hypothetical protein